MTLQDPDIKLLWSRAAGLCSFPDCQEILVRFSKDKNGFYNIGEMAHLKARSLKGPRGKGTFSLKAIDSYENHILLCPTCHTEIDKNEHDYPIKKLIEFKTQHEHWVAEVLLSNLDKKIGFLEFYSNILKRIEYLLSLKDWNWLIDILWRDIAPADIIESIDSVRSILLRTIWPGNKPQLEKNFKSVLQCWSDYSENFESACKYKELNTDFLVSNHIYREMPISERLKVEERQREWSEKNGKLLYKYVLSLNLMIDEVRKNLLPNYRQEEGYFLIHDTLGYRNGGQPAIIMPEASSQKSRQSTKKSKAKSKTK